MQKSCAGAGRSKKVGGALHILYNIGSVLSGQLRVSNQSLLTLRVSNQSLLTLRLKYQLVDQPLCKEEQD